MADVDITATSGWADTSGSAVAILHCRSRWTMEKAETRNQRLDVGDYVLNRGRFIASGATLRLSVAFYGVYSSPFDTGWHSIADPERPLWEGGDIGAVWPTVPGSKFSQMRGQDDGVVAVVPNMPGDITSSRQYTVAHVLEGSSWTALTEQSRTAWVLAAVRTTWPMQNGHVLSLHVGPGMLALSASGDRFVLTYGGVELGSYERSVNDFSVSLIGIGIYNDNAYLLLREGLLFSEGSWITNYNNMVSTGATLGGESSPGMMVYAVTTGTGGKDECRRVLDEFDGFLSC